MSLSKHENVLRVRGEWLSDNKLHIATRLMRSGQCIGCCSTNATDVSVSLRLNVCLLLLTVGLD